ncbi:MAG TPA: hypothetical protein ENI64_08120 [Gammaproteobacteria bacterium]|nr:hypothetical protein [Gammaproteobacteria bacterium]
MSSVTPPIAVAPQTLSAGTKASPESGKNNDFTQVLSGVQQKDTNAAGVSENSSGQKGELAGQAFPEQGSVLPLEGKLLPQNLLAAAENLTDLPLAGELQELVSGLTPTSDQVSPGLLAGELLKPVNPLPAGAILASTTTNRTGSDPVLQTIQTAGLQQGDGTSMIELGDTAMQSDAEPGKKDGFLQAVQEMRLTSLPQALGDTSNQLLSANRDAVASLVNTTTTTAVVPDTARAATMPTLSLDAQLNRPEWRDEMASRVSWLVRNDQSAAQLRINPAHLGPMEISIKMSQDQASVSFISQHIPVREAVELAIPRLREMLEQQGLNLADVDISSGYSPAGQPDSDSADDTGVSDSEKALNGSDSSDTNGGEDIIHTLAGELEMGQVNRLLDEYV